MTDAGAQDENAIVDSGGGGGGGDTAYAPDTPAPGGGSANEILNAPDLNATMGQADFSTATGGGGSRLAGGSTAASKAASKAAELQFQLGEENLAFQREKFGQEFPLEQGQLTGTYQGTPTLTASQLIGTFQGQDTLAKGQLMGDLNGQPTEAAKEFEQRFGLSLAELTGSYFGVPTEKAQEFSQSLAWDKEKFAATLDLQKQDLDIKRGQLAVAYGAAYADAWYKQQEVALAREAHMLQAGQLGLDYLKTATQLHSQPRSWAELADFAAGARQRQDVPVFMANLENAVSNPAFQQYGGTTQPNSAQNVTGELGGSAGPGGVLQSQRASGTPLEGLTQAYGQYQSGGGGGGSTFTPSATPDAWETAQRTQQAIQAAQPAPAPAATGAGATSTAASAPAPVQAAAAVPAPAPAPADFGSPAHDPGYGIDPNSAGLTEEQYASLQGGGGPSDPGHQGGPGDAFAGLPASAAAFVQQQQGPPYGNAYGRRRQKRRGPPAGNGGGTQTPPATGGGGTTTPPATGGGGTTTPPVVNPWADTAHASMLDDLYHNQGWNFQDVQALAAADRIGAAGAHQLAPGSLESLDQQDRDILFGGLDRLGYSADRFARDFIRSRPVQGRATQA